MEMEFEVWLPYLPVVKFLVGRSCNSGKIEDILKDMAQNGFRPATKEELLGLEGTVGYCWTLVALGTETERDGKKAYHIKYWGHEHIDHADFFPEWFEGHDCIGYLAVKL